MSTNINEEGSNAQQGDMLPPMAVGRGQTVQPSSEWQRWTCEQMDGSQDCFMFPTRKGE